VAKKKNVKPSPVSPVNGVAERVQSVIAAAQIVHAEKIATLSTILTEYFDMATPDPKMLEGALAGWKKVHEAAGRSMRPSMISRVFAAATAA